MKPLHALLLGLLAGLAGPASVQAAQAVRTNNGFQKAELPRSDDGSSPPVPLGFTIHYAGQDEREVYISNNGYVVFGRPGGEQFTSTVFRQRLMAAFFADVDTRPSRSATTRYGQDTVDGRPAFAVTWPGVGYFQYHADRLNTFQLVLIDRSDVEPGGFDLEFNYDAITWDCGDNECGDQIAVPRSAMVGYSDGRSEVLLPGSGIPGSLLDGSPHTALTRGRQGSSEPGRYRFAFRRPAPPDGGDGEGPGPSLPGWQEACGCLTPSGQSGAPWVGGTSLSLLCFFTLRPRRPAVTPR